MILILDYNGFKIMWVDICTLVMIISQVGSRYPSYYFQLPRYNICVLYLVFLISLDGVLYLVGLWFELTKWPRGVGVNGIG